MVREYSQAHPACIVRMGAIFSDWCEYPPLYMFLRTWLGESLMARILAGKGQSAIPYIHIRDIVTFYHQILKHSDRLESCEVLLASTSGSTSHLELFDLSTRHYFGKPRTPVLMPRWICTIGLWLKSLCGRIIGSMPFERPWMRHYIDLRLDVDCGATCSLLDWSPGPRYLIEKRLPFLIERLKSEPFSWQVRNLAALKRDPARPGLRIYSALVNLEDQIIRAVVDAVIFPDPAAATPGWQKLDRSDLTWFVRLLYRLLLTSIDTSNRMLVLNYFEISGLSRFQAGFRADEITGLLSHLNDTIITSLAKVPELHALDREIYDCVTMPIEFGKDEIERQYELFLQGVGDRVRQEKMSVSTAPRTAREQLEDTIWACLKHRR